MQENNTYTENIHRFLNKEFSETEMNDFRQKMNSDPKLKADVALEKRLLAGITRVGDRVLKSDISNVSKKLQAEGFFEDSNTESSGGKVVGFSSYRILSIAAGFALAIAVAWWAMGNQTKPSNAELFAQYFQPEKTEIKKHIANLESIGMVGQPTAEDSLRTALQLYDSGNYEAALPALNNYTKVHPGEQIAQFYTALTMMQQGNFNEAAKIFGTLSKSADFENLNWYYALNLLQSPDGENRAIEIFKKVADSDSKNKEAAKSILSTFEH